MTSKPARITLVGGPGDGEEHTVASDTNLLEWKPETERDLVALRMNQRVPSVHDPVKYRRSLRTRALFVYQP